MDSFLKQVVEITGMRNHVQLEKSVVSTLRELINPPQVRILEIFMFRYETYIRQRVWGEGAKIISTEDDAIDEQAKELITNYPVLIDCIEHRKSSAQEVTADNTHILWLPVWLNEKVGTCLEIRQATPYSATLLEVISGIFNVYRNYLSLLDYSERDSLTGLYNRKTFDDKFARMAFSISSNEHQVLDDQSERRHQIEAKTEAMTQWLGIVDIDHFKQINDQFGHLYGDEVLILLGNLLKSSFRSYDRVFRFGGEEFVILLRSASEENAHKIFERFRLKVEQYTFPQVGKVTVSLGFAGISAESAVVILGHADQALYYAKEHGRNQVFFYDQLLGAGLLKAEVSQDNIEFF